MCCLSIASSHPAGSFEHRRAPAGRVCWVSFLLVTFLWISKVKPLAHKGRNYWQCASTTENKKWTRQVRATNPAVRQHKKRTLMRHYPFPYIIRLLFLKNVIMLPYYSQYSRRQTVPSKIGQTDANLWIRMWEMRSPVRGYPEVFWWSINWVPKV